MNWMQVAEYLDRDRRAVVPLGSAPEDIAYAVVFFASDRATWCTGQTLSVDGGRWMG
jgi:NAD(P)-dependent dehydrogenase (short-subunit alcohol dehydrogenase family)